jgi:hypothetical protein
VFFRGPLEAVSVEGCEINKTTMPRSWSAAAAAAAEGREDLRILQVAAHKVALATDLE